MSNKIVKVNNGQTCTVDHFIQEFSVVVRSLGSVHPDELKRLIQQKYEVPKCELINVTPLISPGCGDFIGDSNKIIGNMGKTYGEMPETD